MQEDNSVTHTRQAEIWQLLPEYLARTPSADDPELIELSDNFLWRLRHLQRGGTILVHRVRPCPDCRRPVARVRLSDDHHVLILNATRVTVPCCPEHWQANLFESHVCGVSR